MLGGSRLQEDGGGVPVDVGGAPLDAPPLHPQLLLDLLHFGLQQPLLGFQPLLLRLPEAAIASPVEPGQQEETAVNTYLFSYYQFNSLKRLPRFLPAVVRGRRPVFRDGQRGPGSHQVVTGVVGEAAGLAQSAGGADTGGETSSAAESRLGEERESESCPAGK